MRFVIETNEIEKKRNINGKVLSSKKEYIIVAKRWLRRPLYLRLLPGWEHQLNKGSVVSIELLKTRYMATRFCDDTMTTHTKEWAERVIKEINNNPDNFVRET